MTLKNKKTPLEGGPTFGFKNRIIRFVWNITWLILASWTPSKFYQWRCLLLRLFGAKIGLRSDVRGSSRVWLPSNLILGNNSLVGPNVNFYNQDLIEVGNNALISQGAHLCAGSHDIDDSEFTLITKPIFIGEYAWVAADAFVGPGCVIEEGAVVGARGVAFGKLKPWTVYAGNPVKPVRKRKIVNNEKKI